MKTEISLKNVPETMLWPLWNRAGEQKHPYKLIDDPISKELVDRIDYDFEKNFGKPTPSHVVRARLIDDAIKQWLARNPDGTIVALGEGLESQFWRVDNARMQWISVDLPESIAVRNQFLPKEDRIRSVPRSALDLKWMDEIPKEEPVFISMAGLLMYFKESEVSHLLKEIAERFKKCEVFFDLVPIWFSRKSIKGIYLTKHYKMPATPWGLNFKDSEWILKLHPSLRLKRKMNYSQDFPKRMRPCSWLTWIPFFRNKITPWMIHLEVSN